MKRIYWLITFIIAIGIIGYFISGELATLLGVGGSSYIIKKSKEENDNIDDKIKENEKEDEKLSDDLNELNKKEEELEEEYENITNEEVGDKVEEDNRSNADQLNDILANADESTRE